MFLVYKDEICLLLLKPIQNQMKLTLLFIFSLPMFLCAQWNDLNTGINDELTGVVFWGDNGVVSGHKGIYYTNNGGAGAASWTRFNITGNSTDSLLYNRTHFNHCISNYLVADTPIFACGRDTVNNTAVVFKFDPISLIYSVVYTGASNTTLNNISYCPNSAKYFAVGNDGLIVSFPLIGSGSIENSSLTGDLKAVHFIGNYFLVAAGNMVYSGEYASGITNVIGNANVGTNMVDVFYKTLAQKRAVGSAHYYLNGSLVSGSSTYYDFGALNANAIMVKNSIEYVATDHGVFKNTSSNRLEWQPSSGSGNFSEFWYANASPTNFYVCGSSGKVFKSTNDGGPTKPFIQTGIQSGGCLGQTVKFTYSLGTALSSNIQWSVDGVPMAGAIWTGASSLGLGEHTMSLWSSNNTYSDTASLTFHVVDTPSVSMPFTVLDDILCKKEAVDLTIFNSEDSVRYEFYTYPANQMIGLTSEGNGGALNLLSDSLSTTTECIIIASSTYATCKNTFEDTIQIIVEHPKANFHVGLINGVIGEEIPFYNTSSESQFYEWNFYGSAQQSSSSLENLSNSYLGLGQDSIKLISWTSNGCYDSIIKLSTNIYDEPSVENECWVNHNNSAYPGYEGWTSPKEAIIVPSQSGYYSMGTNYSTDFASQLGVTSTNNGYGAFFQKFNHQGVLKWQIKADGGVLDSRIFFVDAVENSNGEVYVSGKVASKFIDNTGDTIQVPGGFKGILIKLDSLGRTIWYRTNSSSFGSSGIVALDNDENVYVISSKASGNTNFYWKLNSLPTDTLVVSDPYVNYCLSKLNPEGETIWNVPMHLYENNSIDYKKIEFDALNNLYLVGQMDTYLKLYDTQNPTSAYTMYGSNFGKIFLVKFNSLGAIQWSVRSATSDRSIPLDMETDAEGNSYISGKGNCRSELSSSSIENSDGSIFTGYVGQFYVMKVNSDGITKWMKGAEYSYYGYGYELELIDDTIFIIGQLSAWQDPATTVYFKNVDSTAIELTIHESNYFVAVYDTTGYIHRVVVNGNNDYTVNSLQSPYGFSGFFKAPNGSFYSARSVSTGNSHQYYVDFGDTIWSMNQSYDGIINRFIEDCGILNELKYVIDESVNVCLGEVYTFYDGNSFAVNVDTIYTSEFTAVNGLDSLIRTHINALTIANGTNTYSVCPQTNFTFPDGSSAIISSDTIHTSYLTSYQGCDSISIVDISVYPVGTPPIIDFISSTNSLRSIQVYSAYQWIDCNTNQAILGAINQVYNPIANGSYALTVPSGNGCFVTSECMNIMVNTSGLNENNNGMNSLMIVPNPNSSVFTISGDDLFNIHTIEIVDVEGRIIYTRLMNQNTSFEFNHPLDNGTYFVRCYSTDKLESTIRMVVNRD